MFGRLYEVALGFAQIVVYLIAIPTFYVPILTCEAIHAVLCAKRRAHPKSALITGGASGIGRALALEYARRGTTNIALSDVNEVMLKEAKAEVEAAGAAVTIAKLDVCDKEAMQRWIYEVDAAHPLDIVHANAGLAESSPAIDAFVDLEKAANILTNVNVMGVVYTVLPALACMRARGAGQIAITASLAGLTTYLTSIPSYAASKNWARCWALGLRSHFWHTGVRVNALCPGFIDTNMTRTIPKEVNGVATKATMLPGLLSVDWAAAKFVDGLALDKAVITFPAPLVLTTFLLSHAPLPVMDFLLRVTPTGLGGVFGACRPELMSRTPARKEEAAAHAPAAVRGAGAGAILVSPASRQSAGVAVASQLGAAVAAVESAGEMSVSDAEPMLGAAAASLGEPAHEDEKASAGGARKRTTGSRRRSISQGRE